MGTVVTFEVRHTEPDRARAAVAAATTWLHHVDRVFSTYRPDSDVRRLDRGDATEAECDPDVALILDLAEGIRVETDGYFDVRAGGRLDPSGVVKGWAVERASSMLADAGCHHHAVNGGGDVRVRGCAGPGTDWRVGLTHPLHPDAYCGAVHLADGAVATSGIYERGTHVLDPHRGRPARSLSAVTVVGPELVRTDAYATAALAMGPDALEWLSGLPRHEALLVDRAGRAVETPGFGRYRLDVAGAR